jgi:cyclopropane-fatty-acyl-phospholipid synthase
MTALATINPGASAAAIRHHYDLGNEFYRLWLDPTLTYSCALWGSDDAESLEEAQLRKIDHHIRGAGAETAANVLDVGCGWGGVLRRLVEAHGVERAVGLTLSEQQAQHVSSLDDPRVEVRTENWHDHAPDRRYDAVISIGAFEHFAKQGLSKAQKIAAYRAFFERCHEWTKPGAGLSLQTIVYGNAGSEDFNEFFDREIFPESDLPHIAEIVEAADRLFEIVTLRNDRRHYERTLQIWRQRLKARWNEAVALVGEQSAKRYDRYFQLCMIGFHVGTMGLARIALRRIDVPRGRAGG